MTMLTDLGIHVDETKGGNQKTICAKCSHTRKNKLDPCLSVNLDDGTYYCHHCKWKGAIRKMSLAISSTNRCDSFQSLSVNADPMVRVDGRGI